MEPSPASTPAACSDFESAALARRVRLGDREAFESLYRRHARSVHAVLAARLRPEEAEDRVQEVFLKAWATRADLREPERAGAWLVAIARREAIAAARSMRASVELSDEHADPRPDGRIASETGAIVLQELRELPDAYRETLALRLLGELSGAAIAELAGLTLGSVRVNLHKGMELLRERLKRRGMP